MNAVPPEIIIYISEFLDTASYTCLRLTNKECYSLLSPKKIRINDLLPSDIVYLIGDFKDLYASVYFYEPELGYFANKIPEYLALNYSYEYSILIESLKLSIGSDRDNLTKILLSKVKINNSDYREIVSIIASEGKLWMYEYMIKEYEHIPSPSDYYKAMENYDGLDIIHYIEKLGLKYTFEPYFVRHLIKSENIELFKHFVSPSFVLLRSG